MIPIRVPADARPRVAGTVHTLQPDDPLTGVPCPVCDEPFAEHPIVLVHVGSAPREHASRGWTTGAAVPVHASCALADRTPRPAPRLGVELLDELTGLLAERVDWSPCGGWDHHGYCQLHGWLEPDCWQARAQKLLTRLGVEKS